MKFEIVGEVRSVETIASGRGIRILARLNRLFGSGNWRKLKGVAAIRFEDGTLAEVELHWLKRTESGSAK